MSTNSVEFCLLLPDQLPLSNSTDKDVRSLIARQIANCLTRSKLRPFAGDNHTKAHITAVASCTGAQGEDGVAIRQKKHFVLVKVLPALLYDCAATLRPDLERGSKAITEAVHSLTSGQRAWLAEVGLRSLILDSASFNELSNLLNLPSSSSTPPGPPSTESNLFTFQQLGLISEVVLRHDRAEHHALWTNYFHRWNLFPPSEPLRGYFGDSVGFYFAWMRTYCLYLTLPMCIGLVLYVVATLIAHLTDIPDEVDRDLSSYSLISIRACHTFLMILWALVCTKLWTRQHATLVEQWSTNPILERTANDLNWLFTTLDQRAAFQGQWRSSPVTGEMELHFPASKRRLRCCISAVVIMVCLLGASCVHVLLLNLEGYVTLDQSPMLHFPWISQFTVDGAMLDPNNAGILPYLPGVVHSLLVFAMNQLVFRQIAEALTDWENHKSCEQHDQAVIIKRFLFETLDAYGCLAYLGFILIQPGAVRSLVMTMLFTDCLRRFLLESLIPLCLYRLRVWRTHRTVGQAKRETDEQPSSDTGDVASVPQVDLELFADPYEPFDDYLEMILQHGYLVLFAHVSPLRGAAIACISTLIESHLDAIKMLLVTKRPAGRLLLRGSSIWLALLAAQAWLSILTNVGMFVASLDSSSVYNGENEDVCLSLVFLGLEHALVLIGLVAHFFVSDVPADVRDARRSRDFARAHALSHTTTPTASVPGSSPR